MNTDRLTQTRVTSDPFCPPVDWRDQFAEACRSLRLSQQPLDPQRALLTGFTTQYKMLKSLPRRQRRLIQRQWKQSLAGVALLFALGVQPALAATINVGGQCTLIRAIVSANNDASPRGYCRPGRGADRIVLPRNSTVTLTTVNNTSFGPTGLPTIRSVMTIDGNGSTIRRAGTAPDFRILAVTQNGNLHLQETTITGGIAATDPTEPVGNGAGGGLFNDYGTVTVVNSTVSGNKAAAGGGLYSYTNADLTVTNSTVSGNRASGDGGGVYTGEDTRVNLINSTISGNRAGANGGGLFNYNDSALINVTSSTISGNQAGRDGGGVYVGYSSGIRITNSTVSGNKAVGSGGGIHTGYGVSVTLSNSTLTGNTAASGGGVFNDDDGRVQVNRSLISGNNASSGREIFNEPDATFTAADFNLFGHSGLTAAQAFGNFTPGGTDITATSDGDTPTALGAILNRSLASNGGATSTHALVTGSPAIDAINNGTCPPPATDQRGVSRPRDGNGDGGTACDIGSFEVANAPAPVPSAKCQGVVATIVGTAGDDYLVGTAGRDVIQGLAGNDRLVGLEGNDLICGGKGNDNVYGGPGNDKLFGELGNDRLLGVDGNDQISGGSERDTIDGGAGSDRCDGGSPASGDKATNCESRVNIP